MLTVANLISRAEQEELRVVLSMPPRHGKTLSFLHGIAWRLSRHPHLINAYVTYGQSLSNTKSRALRRMAVEPPLRVPLAADANTVQEWETTRGGGLLATGINGPLTGKGITGIGLVDDPFKGRADAESALQRDKVWDWFTNDFMTRLEPGSSAIVMATRWHEDDLSGRLANLGGWEVINLPALTDDGTALWPERFSAERLAEQRALMGEYAWASLYQGQPRPRGDTVFGDGFALYDHLPAGPYREAHGFDAAYTAKTHADHTVLLTGRWIGDRLYITGMGRWQKDASDVIDIMRQRGIRHLTWIRSGTEKGLEVALRRAGIRVTAITASSDKYDRAQPAATAARAGSIVIPSPDAPQYGPWVEVFAREVLDFTGLGDRSDDIVDALAALYSELSGTARPVTSLRAAEGLYR